MLKIGNTVKVISKINGVEYIKIGTICKIIEIHINDNGKKYYNIIPLEEIKIDYWYYEDELEKGHLEWIKN